MKKTQHRLLTLAFFAKYPGVHAFNRRHTPTMRAVRSLEREGFLRVDWATNCAEFTGLTISR